MLTRLLLGLALVALPSTGAAQAVVGLQNLSFGAVIPGVPTSVLKTDPVRSGQFRITGAPLLRNVSVRFTLPTVMNGPLGATMPIAFSNTDAGFSGWNGSIANQNTFNPNAPSTQFIWWGTAGIFLGGTVNPSPVQRGGNYTANIVLTIVFL